MKRCSKISLLILLLVAFAVTEYLAESSRPDWKKVSPFTAVEIANEEILVEYEGATFQLISIERITTSELVSASKKRFGQRWDKRIREDIAEVLEAAGVESSQKVELKLREPDSGDVKTIPDAKMTKENRNKIYQSPRP